MTTLIDDLLKLSRVGYAAIRRTSVDLSSLVWAIAETLRKSAPQRAVEFVVPEGVTAVGDSNLLRVALENLLGNAWKFTGKHDKARIEFGIKDQDGEQVYFVRDDGAGFDMRSAERLFGVFQRLHRASDFAGTGVGLTTVARIIRRMGAKYGPRLRSNGELRSSSRCQRRIQSTRNRPGATTSAVTWRPRGCSTGNSRSTLGSRRADLCRRSLASS